MEPLANHNNNPFFNLSGEDLEANLFLNRLKNEIFNMGGIAIKKRVLNCIYHQRIGLRHGRACFNTILYLYCM